MRSLLTIAFALGFVSCQSPRFDVEKSAAFDIANRQASDAADAPVAPLAICDGLDAFAFATVSGQFPGGGVRYQARLLRKAAARKGIHADFFAYEPGELVHSGTSYGPGLLDGPRLELMTSSALHCMRRLPVGLGIVLGSEGMARELTERARESGLLDGDTVLSVDGVPLEQDAQLGGHLLGKRPGDVVELQWIRPGSGRMSGRLTLGEPLPLPDFAAADLTAPEVPEPSAAAIVGPEGQ